MKTKNVGRPIGYEDVKDLLSIVDDRQWNGDDIYPPYELRTNGIFAKTGFRHPEFSREMQKDLRPWFPPDEYGNYEKPVLPLPCEAEDFIEFINGAELWDRVTLLDGTLIDLWSELGLPEARDENTTNDRHKSPPLLKTPDMARVLGGVQNRDQQGWRKFLSSKRPNWKQKARVPGKGKPSPDLWNPLKLAAAILGRDETAFQDINQRFRRAPELKAWLQDWQDFSDKFTDP
jgi:hypothetical protein